jgi:hypothetical protein
MTHAELIKACKRAERTALQQAKQNYPDHLAQQLSGRYLVVEPFVNFGSCRWDNSMHEFMRVMHRAQDRSASSFYITGVVNVAKEKHHFTINQYIANAATWRVDINLEQKRPFDIKWDDEPIYREEQTRETIWKVRGAK